VGDGARLQASGGADQNGEYKMTQRWLMGAAAAALTVAGAFAAQAADLPTRKEAPAPVFVPPPFTWTGFYVGANAGGVWTNGNSSSTLNAFGIPIAQLNLLNATIPNQNFGSGQSGFIGGGQAGYNYQWGSAVLGVETDFDGSTLSRNRSFIGPTFVDPLHRGGNDFFTLNGSARLSWLGSTRARIGWVATPDNRLLIYGTGGVAYGGGHANLSVFDATNGWYWSTNNNNSSTRVGWTAGGGVEYAFTNNIIIGAEYLYFHLGSRTINTYPSIFASNFFGPGVTTSTNVKFEGSVARARISYKF
jgi:outer membrane immunogenic protein